MHHVKVRAMILDCNEVISNRLWVGGYVRAEDIMQLKQMGITAVVSMQSDQDLADFRIPINELLMAYEASSIEFNRIPTQDFDRKTLSSNISKAIIAIEKAMTPRWAKVYLQCTAGVNRGPTVAAAYLMKTKRLSAQSAYDYVLSRRRCNPFLDVLEQYEEFLKYEHGD